MTKTQCLNQLVKMVCEKEGGRKQLNAGMARETIKVFAQLIPTSPFNDLFFEYIKMLDADKKKAKKKK